MRGKCCFTKFKCSKCSRDGKDFYVCAGGVRVLLRSTSACFSYHVCATWCPFHVTHASAQRRGYLVLVEAALCVYWPLDVITSMCSTEPVRYQDGYQ